MITAQLQQAISLLTMTNIELSAYLESQAEENPFLDCDPAVETTAELPAAVEAVDMTKGETAADGPIRDSDYDNQFETGVIEVGRGTKLGPRDDDGFDPLSLQATEDPSLSRMTIVTTGSDDVIEQITKHLNRLIEVVKVVDLSEGPYTERELMLIKVRAVGKEREEMKRMADIFRGRIIDVTDKTYTIELTGDSAKLDAFIEAIDRAAILETVRTGTSGIGRGERILRV